MKNRSGQLAIRFRLQTALVLLTAFLICLGLFTRELHRQYRKNQSASEVRRLGGLVHINLRPQNRQTSVINGYLRVLLGDDFFTEVDVVGLKPQTAKELDLLLSFPEMKRLSLVGDSVKDISLAKLRSFTQLRSFSLKGAILDDQGLRSLTDLPQLESLRFEDCSLADQSLKSLMEFRNLHSLDFTNCSMSDECFKSLRQSPNLSLSFKNRSLTDSNLQDMHGAKSSVLLSLNLTGVTEAGILAIRLANPGWSVSYRGLDQQQMEYKGSLPSNLELPKIDKLQFQGSLTSDATLAVLKEARNLTALEFDRCSITDDGLQFLKPLKNLKSLSISRTPLSDASVSALKELTRLQVLSLTESGINGIGLAALPSSITTLVTEAQEKGVKEIVKLPHLELLYLVNTSLSEESIDDLGKLHSLRGLYLMETSISDAGVARLRQLLPNCTIESESSGSAETSEK